ncbi:MAG: hypothetical protein NC123_16750 [Butyrivibrio sp.]|nr:hypothetical protein [Acetatifactor muris]MCM1561167.1 hypothetical protein [Butyrivibrio sp.]
MSYVTWEYYSSLFAKVPRDEFERLAVQAEKRVNSFTRGRAERFLKSYDADTDFHRQIYDAVHFTICEVMNKLYLQETSGVGSGLSSVSNDGYSESYKVATESEKQEELNAVIRSGLSGTGLAGVL